MCFVQAGDYCNKNTNSLGCLLLTLRDHLSMPRDMSMHFILVTKDVGLKNLFCSSVMLNNYPTMRMVVLNICYDHKAMLHNNQHFKVTALLFGVPDVHATFLASVLSVFRPYRT